MREGEGETFEIMRRNVYAGCVRARRCGASERPSGCPNVRRRNGNEMSGGGGASRIKVDAYVQDEAEELGNGNAAAAEADQSNRICHDR